MTREETEFRTKLADLDELAVKLKIQIDQARIAADHSFIGRRNEMHIAMCRAQIIGREIVETCIDAQVEVA